MTTVAFGLFFLVWCFLPSRVIRGPVGVALGIASIVVVVAAYRILLASGSAHTRRRCRDQRITEEG